MYKFKIRGRLNHITENPTRYIVIRSLNNLQIEAWIGEDENLRYYLKLKEIWNTSLCDVEVFFTSSEENPLFKHSDGKMKTKTGKSFIFQIDRIETIVYAK